MRESLIKQIAAVYPRMVEHRRALHQIPEVGMELPKTASYVSNVLKELGLKPQRIGGDGVTVTLGEGERTLLLRADMDALAVVEPEDRPFRADNGNMHACGHDLHTAILLGAAEIFHQQEAQLPCRVKLVFQPGEELGTGARDLIADGLLQNPTVDAAVALHVDPSLEIGKIVYCSGVATSDIYDIFIEIQGKGGHSSRPEAAVNALAAANGIYSTLSGLVQREVGGFETAILAFCAMEAGTFESPNIIPERCRMSGTLRCFDRQLGARLIERIRTIVRQQAVCYGAVGEIETLLTPSLVIDPKMAEVIGFALRSRFGQEQVRCAERPISGSEDFSYIAEQVPAFFCWLGAKVEDGPGEAARPGQNMLHNPNVLFDEAALKHGLMTMVEMMFAWAEGPKQE